MEDDIASEAATAFQSGQSQYSYFSAPFKYSLSDLRAATEAFKTKEQSYQELLENKEIERAKASRAEASG